MCLASYESSPLIDDDLEAGLWPNASQQTLRVPENGGVE